MTDYSRQPPMPDADVVIVPTIPEWQENAAEYLELSEVIRADLDLSAVALDRGIPHSGADLPDFVPLAFLIYLGTRLADAAIDAVAERVTRIIVKQVKFRRWSRDGRAEGRILGPNGEVLRRVILDPKDKEAKWTDPD